ncbi:endonuclease [Rossellomorea marisflavi]|uniref:Endonuclease n=1 Tax=Rossellomorea marisflavi TaxID=189381 RepID=A0A5D4RUD4_9BACI|nr:Z1 domain-containing protein [Rossellomorea marisflavi]TYS54943.1 endonuclease [Rossellomorea marisflavi]
MQDTKETNPNIMYNQVKGKISGAIQENKNLQEDSIQELVNEWKSVISSTPPHILKTILGIHDESIIHNLTDDEWKYIQYELEQAFDVRITTGILVTGEDQRSRDLTWWTSKRKLEGENYYSNNYFKYMKDSLPPQVLETIDEDTDAIMNNLANPESEVFSRYGMVVGHVQSGKTSNYASLICKAADAGYRFIVVIAGGQNNLRDQTQSRLDEVFVGANYQGVANVAGFKRDKMPDSLTNEKNDFKIETARARVTTNFENMQLPILVVIKKHTKTLSHLLKWLNTHYKNQIDKAMLVIDDESDYASINTRNEDDPTVINGKIRLLLQKFKKSAYVAYTATPYANIFIDHKANNIDAGRDLFPSDFIYALDAPSNYFGAEKIFIKENKKFVVQIPESEVVYEIDENDTYPDNNYPFIIKHKKEYHQELEVLPDSLYDAIRLFIINIAIRDLRKQKKHNSMLIHISRFTDVHVQIRKLVSNYFTLVKDEIKAFGAVENPHKYSGVIKALRNTLNDRLKNVEFDFEVILGKICTIIETIEIRDVHQSAKIPLKYRDDRQTNAIVIGGLSLSRGFTLEGLSVSYFLRTTIYYDTLMQMGRWFGYRVGYEDLCRVYITEDMNEKFGFIIEATNDLISRLKDMRDENLTPADFGLSVQLHPDSLLQVTARNKSQNTEDMYLEMNLDGQIKETRWISSLPADLESNEFLLEKTISLLVDGEYKHQQDKSHIWRDVDKGIIEQFVKNYKLYSNDPLGLKSRMPIDFIKTYVKECDLKWDVVLYNGSIDDEFQVNSVKVNRQLRKVKVKKGYYEVANRQLSRANPEKIVMTEENKNLPSREMRSKLEKPLLMLHSLKLNDEKDNKKDAVGFGISFPTKKGSFNKSIKVRINSVYKKQLEEAYRDGGGADFEYE